MEEGDIKKVVTLEVVEVLSFDPRRAIRNILIMNKQVYKPVEDSGQDHRKLTGKRCQTVEKRL